jgi:hypothetical protein
MMRNRIISVLLLFAAVTGSGAGAHAEDALTSCFQIKPKSGANFYALGGVLRQSLLNVTATKFNVNMLSPEAPAGDFRRCTGIDPAIPNAGPTAANYFGHVSSKLKFLRMSRTNCGNGGVEDQYFSIGKAVYYRNCHAGNQVGYISFWGKEDGNSSSCFGLTYPEMFKVANTSPKVTPERMAAIYGRGLPMNEQADYAIGNEMAGIQIAETARDWLVYAQNYMLVEQKIDPVRVIGGRCPANTPSGTCQNTGERQDGLHPLAWGGAQAAMMTNGWGTNNGATSNYGMNFETQNIATWMIFKGAAASASASQCPIGQNFNNLTPAQQNALTDIFNPLFQ